MSDRGQLPTKFDYIVVGGGSAGCVLASRLSEHPTIRVLLLEAGPADRNPLLHIPLGVGKLHQRHLFDWGVVSDPEPGLAGRCLPLTQGKVLGGSSSVNYMAYSRGDPSDYDRWARNGATGWSHNDILPFFKQCETWEDGGNEWRGGSGPVGVQRSRCSDPIAQAWVDAAKALGFSENSDLAAGGLDGFGAFQCTIKDGRRSSSATAYLRPAYRRPNLRIITESIVTRVLFSSDRAIGVEYLKGGETRLAHVEGEVLLCAGPFHSPKLLMLSGIGPAEHLRLHDIQVRLDLPVGKNLQDHVVVENLYARKSPGEFHRQMRFDRIALSMIRAYLFGTGFAATIPSPLWGFVRSEPSIESPDIEFMFPFSPASARVWFPWISPPYPDAFGIRSAILHPRSRGEVLLRSSDPRVPVRVRLNCLTDDEDRILLRRAFSLGRHLACQSALAPFRGKEILPSAACQSDAQLDEYIRRTAHTVHHPVGTCPMGLGEQSVLDPELRVLGVQGLRVVDSSAMPDAISSHTNATVLMMAEKAAAGLLCGQALRVAPGAFTTSSCSYRKSTPAA